MEHRRIYSGNYRKVPKFLDARKLCCNLPKFKERGQTLGYFVKKKQMEANSADPDQTAPSEFALFVQAYLSENLGSLR